MARGDHDPGTFTSPRVFRFPDYQDNAITITINFNNGNRILQASTLVRDPGCVYDTVFWDVGPDGLPGSTVKQFPVPVGSSTITRAMFNSVGVQTVDELLSVNFTVGAAQ